MSKIKNAADSIKSKLSFDSYEVIPESNKNIKTEPHKEEEKVKSTFYIPKSSQRYFDKLYYSLNLDSEEKITRSDLIMNAIDALKTIYPGVAND